MAVNELFKLDDNHPMVYIDGDWYYDPDLGDLPNYTNTTSEEYEVEINDVPAFRRVIGSGDRGEDYTEINGKKILTDRRDKRVYKKITPTSEQKNKNFVLFRLEDQSYYCIRQGCFDCEFKNNCQVEPIIVDIKKEYRISQPFLITNGDIANQEPYVVTLTSKEPMYLATFRNRILRELELTKYIDFVIGGYFNFDPNIYSEKANVYWIWLQQFYWNWEDLIKFNKLVDEFKKTNDSEIEKELEDRFLKRWVEELNQMFDEYLSKKN